MGMNADRSIRFVEEAHVASLLITLYEHGGEIMKTVLLAMVMKGRGNQALMYEKLENMGIITIRRGRTTSSGHWVALTEKGKFIAERLIEIERALQQ